MSEVIVWLVFVGGLAAWLLAAVTALVAAGRLQDSRRLDKQSMARLQEAKATEDRIGQQMADWRDGVKRFRGRSL